jgi:hypothetical protein
MTKIVELVLVQLILQGCSPIMAFLNPNIPQTKMVTKVATPIWLEHLHPQKWFYGAKHALGAFTIVETTNVISQVITSVLLPQWVYRSSIQSHPVIKTSIKYNLPTTKP